MVYGLPEVKVTANRSYNMVFVYVEVMKNQKKIIEMPSLNNNNLRNWIIIHYLD
jgi:hypothetical protein